MENPLRGFDGRRFTSSFEVEMKFRYPEDTERKLVERGAKYVGEKRFTDLYFDTPQFALTSRDIWFRKRDSDWECKVGKRDENGVDRYAEITSKEEIRRFLEGMFPGKGTSSNPFEAYLEQVHLEQFASIFTRRRKFRVEEFNVDLDEMDFGYRIGEVELMVNSQEEAEAASQRVLDFCRRYQLDNAPPIRGKVLEYIMRLRPEHYRQLEISGLISQKVNHQK